MSKARSTGNIGNIIKTSATCVTVNDGTTDLLIMSGSGRVTIPGNLVVLGGIAGSSAESSSYSLSSSFATNANTLDGIDGASFLQTGSFNTFSSSIDTTIKNKLNGDGVISGSVQVDITSTTGYSTFSSSLSSSIGSLSGSVATTTSGLSSSIGSLSSSVATTTSGLSSSIGSLSSSVATTTSDLSSSVGSLSGSVATTTSGLSGRISIVEGRGATTGSNNFIGTQTITGSLYISSDLVVQGSSSLQNITASAVNIGANIVNLNTANPAIRFAGLNIFDSGSIGGSGSFLYDAVQDEFIFVHRGDNSNITSSVVLMGPQTYNNVGNETYLTTNRILKGTGNEHVVDSCIIDDGTTVCVNATLKASGQVCSLMGTFSCIGVGTTSPKTYASITSCGQIISLNNIGIDVGQSYRLNNYYNIGTSTDRTISAGLAASIGLEQSGGAIVFNISSTCAAADTTISSTERMRITCTGNVGIGTNYPRYNLVVGCDLGELSTNSTTTVVGNTASSSYLVVGQGYNRNAQFNWQYCATAACAYGQLVTYNYSNPILIDACKVILQSQSGGFVGIGTCTPGYRLDVNGQINSKGYIINGEYAAVSGVPNAGIYGTDASFADGYNSLIVASRTDAPRPIIFATYNGSTFAERVRITSGGDACFSGQICSTGSQTITGPGLFINRPASSSGEPYIFFNKDGVTRASIYGGNGTAGLRFFSDVNTFHGNVIPDANGTRDLGTASLRWNTVYTSDLSLSNGIGDYTIVEGEDDLFLYNNKQCKVYKFMLQQVCAECATPKKS